MKHDHGDVTCYVIAYDISNDRRRTKVHKVLSGFGQWTQFSLFECHLTAKQNLQLRDRLDRISEWTRTACASIHYAGTAWAR